MLLTGSDPTVSHRNLQRPVQLPELLTNKVSHIIGIIISPFHGSDEINHLENPYISAMLGTIEMELRKNGYFTMLRSVTNKSDILSLIKNWNVDGIIFLYPEAMEYIQSFKELLKCPIAIFDCDLKVPDIINVSTDDWHGLYLATRYVISHGHTHIAFVSDPENNPLISRRFEGYCAALKECAFLSARNIFIPILLPMKVVLRQGKPLLCPKMK